MSAYERGRKRPNTRAEKRVWSWIKKEEQNSLLTNPESNMAPSLGAFTVRRAVKDDTPGGLFERSDILDLLSSDHQAVTYSRVSVSLISPREGKQLADPWNGQAKAMEQVLENIADSLPAMIHGYINRSLVLGAYKNKPGPRYIGYVMDRTMAGTLKDERQLLYEALRQPSPRDMTPHITLLSTNDQRLAEELSEQLTAMAGAGIPLTLGPAQVVPIVNSRSSRH